MSRSTATGRKLCREDVMPVHRSLTSQPTHQLNPERPSGLGLCHVQPAHRTHVSAHTQCQEAVTHSSLQRDPRQWRSTLHQCAMRAKRDDVPLMDVSLQKFFASRTVTDNILQNFPCSNCKCRTGKCRNRRRVSKSQYGSDLSVVNHGEGQHNSISLI